MHMGDFHCHYKTCYVTSQDKGSSDSVDRDIMNDQFDARLVMDDPAASSLFTQPGADGFSFKAQPLFQVK